MEHPDAILERVHALSPNLSQSAIETAAHEAVLETQKRAKLGVDGLSCLLAAPIGYAVFFGVGAVIRQRHNDSIIFTIFGIMTVPTAMVTSLILGIVLSFVLRHHPPLKKRGGLRALCVLIPALTPFLYLIPMMFR